MSAHLREAWRKLADATNWRAFADSPIWREHDAVIMTQFRGRQRYYEVYTYGEDFGHYPRLDDAKAALERIYGPLQWQQITMPKVEVIHYYFGPTTEFTDPLTVYVASLPRLGKMARVTPEQQAFMDRVRSEQQAIFGDAMVCREVTQALHEKYGWPIEAGWYKGPGHDIRPTVGHFPGHWYHRLSDGTIIDPTHDQYQPGTPLQVIPPGDPRQEWYEKIRDVAMGFNPRSGMNRTAKTAMADSLEAVVESLEDTLGQIDNYERTRDLIASGQVGRQFSNQLDVWGYLRDLLPRELPGFDPEWVVVMPSYGRAAGMAAWDGEAKKAVFFIGPDGFNEVVVLHEVAHIIDQYKNGGRGHGPRFNGILSDLYGRYLGLKWAKLRVRYLEKV